VKKPLLALGICFLGPVLGCGKTLDAPVDPDQASAVLRTVLEAWKQGDGYGELQKRNPPMYFNEPEWKAGKKLMAFKTGKVELMGRQGRCLVKLTLKDQAGTTAERQISYQIDTTPMVVIARENLGP
jgi:hypothetical protein